MHVFSVPIFSSSFQMRGNIFPAIIPTHQHCWSDKSHCFGSCHLNGNWLLKICTCLETKYRWIFDRWYILIRDKYLQVVIKSWNDEKKHWILMLLTLLFILKLWRTCKLTNALKMMLSKRWMFHCMIFFGSILLV